MDDTMSSRITVQRPSPGQASRPASDSSISAARQSESQVTNPSAVQYHTVMLNTPHNKSGDNSASTQQSEPLAPIEPRHCWICLQDEGEESPSISEWRSPCPCNLQAHEECLLDWISELELSKPRGNSPSARILCPQCKAEIKLARPRDYLAQTTDLVTYYARTLVVPAGISAAIGCLYSGSLVYGINALHLVMGAEDTRNLLYPRHMSSLQYIIGDKWLKILLEATRFTDPFLPISSEGMNLAFGVPLIAPALVLLRSTLLDRVFLSIPLIYSIYPQRQVYFRQWPPSPGLALVLLPYLRAVYNKLYKQIFGDLEKEWDRAVRRKPREGETEEQVAREQNEWLGGNGIIEIEAEVVQIEEEEEEEQQEDQEDIGIINPPPAVEAGVPQQMPNAELGRNPGQPPHQHVHRAAPANEQWEFRADMSTGYVTRTVVGALFFPAISSIMGDVLKYALPKDWVTKSIPFLRLGRNEFRPSGLLQEKWGRSFVGGCLFVVLKDALILYTKWKKAKMQGQRKVIDYAKKDGAQR